MKYGVLLNKNNLNVGDDIQALALAQFLPSLDYFIDREHIDEFRPDNDEPVAVIMNAWYMWAKWNWPPSKYIIPKFVGFHYADHQLAVQPGSPVKYEFLTGLGGEYLKAHQPIGCRDEFTRSQLESLGIESYFSGCITMTLPKRPERPDKGTYICLVDLEPKVRDKMKKLLEEQGIEVKVITHNRKRNAELSWKEREEYAIELLTTYQNARCVVTKRLHCALPCLAMEVPVFMIKEMTDDIRFTPYYDFLHRTTVTKFMNDDYSYDFVNPPANKDDYKPYREQLIKDAKAFVDEMEQTTGTVDELNRFKYSDEEVKLWRHDVMKEAMDKWLWEYRVLQIDTGRLQKKNDELKKQLQTEREKCKKLEARKLSKRIRRFAKRIIKKIFKK